MKRSKERRRVRAAERAAKRASRSDAEQLKLLDSRSVRAARERERLMRRLAK